MVFELDRFYRIGTIFLTNTLDESKISSESPNFKSINGKCFVDVYSKEGDYIPHFHITSADKKFSCCIELFRNRFFQHGKHKDVLIKKDWKVLDKWMRSANLGHKNFSNWDIARSMWDTFNGKKYKDNNNIIDFENQPDYSKMDI